MGDNNDDVAAANAGRYTFLSSSYQILLEFLVLLFGVDVIGLSCLDAIYSSTLLICMISSSAVYVVMIYQLLVRINSYDNLLIYSTIQKPDYRQMNSSGIATATRPPLFDGSHYKRWRTRAVLWFQNLKCYSAPLMLDLRVRSLLQSKKNLRRSTPCLRRPCSVFLGTTLLTRT